MLDFSLSGNRLSLMNIKYNVMFKKDNNSIQNSNTNITRSSGRPLNSLRVFNIFNVLRFNNFVRIQQRYRPKVHVCFSNRKKLALLMGLNYENDARLKLRGCINDTVIIKDILVKDFGYTENDIILLTDNTEIKPTKRNIENELNKILARVRSENIRELFISFSGHGASVRDMDRDESDGRDEALVPLDVYTNGIITDDYIHAAFLSKLPSNVNVFSIIDCCHSGTIFDLQYKYVHHGGSATNGVFVVDNRKRVGAKVLKIGGSRDDQYGADAFLDGEFKGAMTNSFSKTYKQSRDCRELLINISRHLKSLRFTQQPVLTCSFNYNKNDILLLK